MPVLRMKPLTFSTTRKGVSPMPEWKIAHIREQGVDLVIISLET